MESEEKAITEDAGRDRRMRKFLKVAQELRASAEREKNLDLRAKYLEIAFQWVLLADEAAQLHETKNVKRIGKAKSEARAGKNLIRQ